MMRRGNCSTSRATRSRQSLEITRTSPTGSMWRAGLLGWGLCGCRRLLCVMAVAARRTRDRCAHPLYGEPPTRLTRPSDADRGGSVGCSCRHDTRKVALYDLGQAGYRCCAELPCGESGFKRSSYWPGSGLGTSCAVAGMAGMARADASLQVSLGNIFVRRLRNPVGGHFGADCDASAFRGLRGAHHFGDSNSVVCQRSGCPVSRTTITL